jgi:hypothetical protein
VRTQSFWIPKVLERNELRPFGYTAHDKARSSRNDGAKINSTQACPEEVDLPLETEITPQKGVRPSFTSDRSYWTVT